MGAKEKLILCPYCGATQTGGDRCKVCGGLVEPLSRRATQISMGPWYIRDKKVPFRPGCSYDVLVKQIKAGRVKPTTILRGPTTRQFWSVARNVAGLAHLLGYCHRCGAHVKAADKKCHACGEPFVEPRDRNELGLLYTTEKEAAAAQRALDREIEFVLSGGTPSSETQKETAVPEKDAKPGAGLLTEVLGGEPRAVSEVSTESKPAPVAEKKPEPSAKPTGPKPSSLDFTPTEGQGEMGEEDELEEATSKNQLLTYVLVAFNVIVLVAVLVLVFVNFTGNRDENDNNNGNANTPAAQPEEIDGDTNNGAASSALDVDDSDGFSAATTDAANDNRVGAATDGGTSIFDTPDDEATDRSTSDATGGDGVSGENPDAAVMTEMTPFVEQLIAAQELEEAGKYKQALLAFRDLQPLAPNVKFRKLIDNAVSRTLEKVDQEDPSTFYDLPVEDGGDG